MQDLLRVREHLRLALLLCTPLAVASCQKEEASPTPKAVATDTPTASTPTADVPVAPTPPPVDYSLRYGTRNGGTACVSAAALKKVALPDAGLTTGEVAGCPTEFTSREAAVAVLLIPPFDSFGFDQAETAKRRASSADTCCYSFAQLNPGGRPLLDGGDAIVAETRAGASWSPRTARVGEGLPALARERLAAEWLEDARKEHASVASFARTTLELLAVGAPASLVRDAQRAGLDEVRHAERCFELASAYGGAPVEPGPLRALAPRPADLEQLAVDTFVEGCVGETLSAVAALRAARQAPASVAPVWAMLGADETRHADLAWRTVAWIVLQRPSLAARLVAVAAEIERQIDAIPPPPESDALEGRLSPRELASVQADAWRQVIRPTLALIVGDRGVAVVGAGAALPG